MISQRVEARILGIALAVALGMLFASAEKGLAQERARLRADHGLATLALSHNGKLLAISDDTHTIVLYEVASCQPVHALKAVYKPGKGSLSPAGKLAFTPDGKTLVAVHVGFGEPGGGPAAHYLVVKHWDLASGRERSSYILSSVGFLWDLSADGRILVAVYGRQPSKTAKVWDLTAGKEIATLYLGSSWLRAAAVSDDGKVAAVGGVGGEVKLFDLPSGKPRGGFKLKKPGGVGSLSFVNDGRLLAAYNRKFPKAYQFWDVAAGKEFGLPLQLWQRGFFLPDGKVVATPHDGEIHLLSVPDGALLGRLKCRQEALGRIMAFRPDGRTVIVGCTNAQILLLTMPQLSPLARDARYRLTLKHPGKMRNLSLEPKQVVFSPDSKTIAFATGASHVKLWDVATGKEVALLGGQRHGIAAVAFSPNGKTLATSAPSEPAQLWDLAARKVRLQLKGCAEGSSFVAYAPDGKTVATAECDHVIRLWDPASGKLLAELRGPDRYLTMLAYSPDGKTLACAANTGGVALWDLATRKVRARLPGPRFVSLAWTPDSRTLATALARSGLQKELVLWDAVLGKERQRLAVRPSLPGLYGLAFAPDGKTLAAVGMGRWMQLWDIGAGRLLAELHGGRAPIRSVAFSPNGRSLACAGLDDTVRLWDLPAAKP